MKKSHGIDIDVIFLEFLLEESKHVMDKIFLNRYLFGSEKCISNDHSLKTSFGKRQ